MMNELLENPATNWIDKSKNVAFAFLVILIWVTLMSGLLSTMNYPGYYPNTVVGHLFFMCIWAALWEEAVFRYAPITIAKHFGEQYIIPVVVISSAIFGWGHGDGPTSLLFQGLMGFVLSWTYIKNNYSYWSSTALHCLWNSYCYIIYEI